MAAPAKCNNVNDFIPPRSKVPNHVEEVSLKRMQRDSKGKGRAGEVARDWKGKSKIFDAAGLKGKTPNVSAAKKVASIVAGVAQVKTEPEYITISSDSDREFTPIIEDEFEEKWFRVVKDAKAMRSNVLLIPRAVIRSCLRKPQDSIVLYDTDKSCAYYCELKKRPKHMEKYLFGGWYDFFSLLFYFLEPRTFL